MTQELKGQGAYSLVIIKEADARFFSKILLLADEYTKEMDCKGVMQNTEEGYYELIAIPNKKS